MTYTITRVSGDERGQDAMTDNRQGFRKKDRTRKCPWRTRSRIQCGCMSMALDMRCETVSAALPMATSLSQNNGVAGWGWPMLAKIFRSSVAFRAAAYKPAYSASATKE